MNDATEPLVAQQPQAAPPAPDFDAERLRDLQNKVAVLADSAANAHQAAGEIGALAKLLLDRLETPEAYREPQLLGAVLQVILDRALGVENDLDVEAEQVGVRLWGDASKRRHAAYMAARRSTAAG